MRYAQNLLAARKIAHFFAYALSGNTGNTGVNFVKHHCFNRVVIGKCGFHCKHYSAKLAAGCDLRYSAKLHAGVCGDKKAHIVGSRFVKAEGRFHWLNGYLEPHRWHTEIAKLAANTCFELFCGLFSARRKQRRLFYAVILML